jgi:hypothetical protein
MEESFSYLFLSSLGNFGWNMIVFLVFLLTWILANDYEWTIFIVFPLSLQYAYLRVPLSLTIYCVQLWCFLTDTLKAQKMESKTENLVTSAAAFVEGGIQESCDDACSICLEEFCDNDPSTVILTNTCIGYLKNMFLLILFLSSQVTVCRHEFHLQCVLDWYYYYYPFISNNWRCSYIFSYIFYTLSLNLISKTYFKMLLTLICRCQRSSQCPMCWQPLSLTDPTGFVK